MPGIIRSRTITSGICSLAMRNPSAPLLAVKVRTPSASIRVAASFKAAGSSSMTRTVLSNFMVGRSFITVVNPHLGAFERDIERIHEFNDLDRFREIAKESRFQPLRDVMRHGIRTEGDDRDVRGERVGAEDCERFNAADARKIDIHENHFGQLRPRQGNARKSVACGQKAQVRTARDELLHELKVGWVILDIEQRAPGRVPLDRQWKDESGAGAFNRKRRLSGGVELEPEFAARSDGAFDTDHAAHQLDQLFRHHQTNAGAFLATALLPEAVERLK